MLKPETQIATKHRYMCSNQRHRLQPWSRPPASAPPLFMSSSLATASALPSNPSSWWSNEVIEIARASPAICLFSPGPVWRRSKVKVLRVARRTCVCRLRAVFALERKAVCWLVAQRPSNMLVYLSDGSARTSVGAATLRWKLQIKRSHPVTVYWHRADQSQR